MYWYVTNSQPRKWIRLGTDYKRALARWAELEGGDTRQTVATLLGRFTALLEAKESSRKQYATWSRSLVAGLGHYQVSALQTYHVAQWRDENAHRKPTINGCLAVLKGAYEKAREWGWCGHDPVCRGFARTKRDRLLTAAEFRSIRGAGVCWLQNAMDLAYLTSLRQSDLLALRWDRVGDLVAVRQIKTKNRQEFEMNDALREVLDRCKQRRVMGLFVIADERGRQIRPKRLQEHMRKAVQKAGVVDAGFHDIRALAATEGRKQGLDATALLGHRNESQTDTYLRDFEAIKAVPLKSVL